MLALLSYVCHRTVLQMSAELQRATRDHDGRHELAYAFKRVAVRHNLLYSLAARLKLPGDMEWHHMLPVLEQEPRDWSETLTLLIIGETLYRKLLDNITVPEIVDANLELTTGKALAATISNMEEICRAFGLSKQAAKGVLKISLAPEFLAACGLPGAVPQDMDAAPAAAGQVQAADAAQAVAEPAAGTKLNQPVPFVPAVDIADNLAIAIRHIKKLRLGALPTLWLTLRGKLAESCAMLEPFLDDAHLARAFRIGGSAFASEVLQSVRETLQTGPWCDFGRMEEMSGPANLG
ncbi:MAG: hypothetical protein HY519_00495 [Candidatus Aenigmarchaeota archaeon]|nr:hypothetical protein [Candidatus Aenigmarchaeota archaeon]